MGRCRYEEPVLDKLWPIHLIASTMICIIGQERFRTMTRSFYKGASGALILFDVTDEETFGQAAAWKTDIDEKVTLASGLPIPCILLANKVSN